jgi:hypothetical protein
MLFCYVLIFACGCVGAVVIEKLICVLFCVCVYAYVCRVYVYVCVSGNWTYSAGVGTDPREDRYFSLPKQVWRHFFVCMSSSHVFHTYVFCAWPSEPPMIA